MQSIDSCRVLVPPTFAPHSRLVLVNAELVAGENEEDFATFSKWAKDNDYAVVIYGDIRLASSPMLPRVAEEAGCMLMLVPPDNRYRIPNTNLLEFIPKPEGGQLDLSESFVIGPRGGHVKFASTRSDLDRALAYNIGATYLPLWKPVAPVEWRWHPSMPTTDALKVLVATNNAQLGEPMLPYFRNVHTIILTGPPSCGKSWLLKQLKRLDTANTYTIHDSAEPIDPLTCASPALIADNGNIVNASRNFDVFELPLATASATDWSPSKIAVFQVIMNEHLCRQLHYVALQKAEHPNYKMKKRSAFRYTCMFARSLPFTNKLQQVPREFWFRYS
jgi:hypothetical protein